jgi:hypothetical protein
MHSVTGTLAKRVEGYQAFLHTSRQRFRGKTQVEVLCNLLWGESPIIECHEIYFPKPGMIESGFIADLKGKASVPIAELKP